MEPKLVLTKELFKSGYELTAKDAAQCGNGKEEALGGGDPSGTVGRNATSRNNVVYVRMMLKVLPPGMKYAEKPDVCSQMPWVTCQSEQRRCTSAEQQIVKQSLVLQRREFVRQREDDVEVRNRQQLCPARGKPAGAGVSLTSGAVPVTA